MPLRDIEGQHGERQFVLRVLRMAEPEPELGLRSWAWQPLLERLMVLQHLWYLRENPGEILVPAEHEDGGFGVSPRRVPKELIYGLLKAIASFPKLALGDEGVLPFQLIRMSVLPLALKVFPVAPPS